MEKIVIVPFYATAPVAGAQRRSDAALCGTVHGISVLHSACCALFWRWYCVCVCSPNLADLVRPHSIGLPINCYNIALCAMVAETTAVFLHHGALRFVVACSAKAELRGA